MNITSRKALRNPSLNKTMKNKDRGKLIITSNRGVLVIQTREGKHDRLALNITCRLCSRCPGFDSGQTPVDCYNISPCG